ncbi:hybrid sensor histidine kinase/response regulator [Crocosphaera chwakensis]|uniref:histidine kinase n=1 Tax=Crocosphaera chwakensis CCY0110 TaxID=391612 RepID=A3ITQ3_9CHRO|nr:response regulator [Crocosphaera chwakensis]EAZ90119.1 two-component hybrid sensor and regulator [Crocosphaera chwakensis CCY0110]
MNYPKALIIDDNPSDRKLALRQIKKLFPEFKYWEIIDEADFSEALQKQKFNLVVTDYRLRWTTGLDILHRIKQQIPDCPVIMFTGTGSEEIAVEAMKAGLDDYVIKSPKHYIRLAAAIRSAWQRWQQRQALDQIQQTYDRFFKRIPLGLYRLNRAGEILEANPTLMKMFGYEKREELFNQNLANYHLEPDVYRQWQQQLGQVEAKEDFEGRIRNHQQEIIWVSHKAIAVKDKKGEIIGYEGAIADITASKQAELERIQLLHEARQAQEEAERLNHVKDEFLATLSHELRTPLNAIIGWMQLLRSGTLNEDQFNTGLEVIERNANVQTQLIEDLLDVSRIICGTLKLEAQPINVISVILSSIDTVSPTAKAKNININLQLSSQTIEINGDKERLQQVFWNLLINAVKFTPIDGSITIEGGEENNQMAFIRITDTGKGISGDVLPHIFDRFRQAEHKSSTRTQGGLGLGLAIVRHIVEMHGGSVMAESEGIDKGSTFTVELPVIQSVRNQETKSTSASQLNSLPSLLNLNLLVVEDEADAREMITLILEQCGAKIVAASSVRQALSQYQQHPIDVIISDISMPLEDGYELIQQIRSQENEQTRLPAIALTAHAREEDKQKALLAGFDLHLPKPIEPLRLVQSISELIQNRQ